MDASASGALPSAAITHVISNRSAAYGLTRAREHQPNAIPTDVLALKTFQTRNPGATREAYDQRLAELVLSEKPDLVVLAGFMHILSSDFLESLPATLPIINLHPALPGQFDGARAIPRALEAFERGEVDRTGVMVHRVVAEVDRGAPVCVREVAISKGETLEELEARIHEVEHELIVEGARRVLEELRSTSTPKEKKEGNAPQSTEETLAAAAERPSSGSPTASTAPPPSSTSAPPSPSRQPASSSSPSASMTKLDVEDKSGLETLVGSLRIGRADSNAKDN